MEHHVQLVSSTDGMNNNWQDVDLDLIDEIKSEPTDEDR